MTKTLDQFPLHLQKIALLAIEANNIDVYLELLFRTITGIPAELTFAIFGAIQNQRIRRDILAKVAEVELARHYELERELAALLKRIGKAAQRRATIVHAVYKEPLDDKLDNPLAYQPYAATVGPVEILELDQSTQQIRELNRDLKRFGIKVLKERGRRTLQHPSPPQTASPQKSRPRRP